MNICSINDVICYTPGAWTLESSTVPQQFIPAPWTKFVMMKKPEIYERYMGREMEQLQLRIQLT